MPPACQEAVACVVSWIAGRSPARAGRETPWPVSGRLGNNTKNVTYPIVYSGWSIISAVAWGYMLASRHAGNPCSSLCPSNSINPNTAFLVGTASWRASSRSTVTEPPNRPPTSACHGTGVAPCFTASVRDEKSWNVPERIRDRIAGTSWMGCWSNDVLFILVGTENADSEMDRKANCQTRPTWQRAEAHKTQNWSKRES